MNHKELLEAVLHSAAYQQFDREEHDMCKRYYDGYQETQEVKALRAQLQKPTHTPNLFYKYMNTVAGMEEQQRVDIMIAADDDSEEDEQVAEGLNRLMHETCRLHDVNSHCAEAFLPMANAGIAWMYFGRNTDPLGLPFDCHYVPEHEIIWDRRSRRLDLDDCQYVARMRFLAHDEALGLFPEHKELIDKTYATSTDEWGPINNIEGHVYNYAGMGNEYLEHMIRDSSRHMVGVYDVWYRCFEEREVLYFEDGRRAVYDAENPAHVTAKLHEGVPAVKQQVKVMRNAWYIGPHQISDDPSPHPHAMFPYVLYRGEREEYTGAVFALGRSLIPPQDAYNSAHVQQHYLMEKVTVMVKRGSLSGTNNETLEDVQLEAHRADGIIEVNNHDDVVIQHHHDQIAELRNMKFDAERAMEAASGISNSLTGVENASKSGVAQQVQVEQATTTLSSLFANYYFGRMMLGRLILAHLIDDLGTSPKTVQIRSEAGDIKKVIELNSPGDDGQLTNRVSMARTRVTLDDIESTKGYRAQQLQMLGDITPNADERMKPYLTIAAIELSNLPNRHELANDMRKIIGKGVSEEEQAEMDKAASEQAQKMQQLDMAEREANIELTKAQAAKARADAGINIQNAENPPEQVQPDPKEAANDAQAELELMQRKQGKVAQIREAMAKRELG